MNFNFLSTKQLYIHDCAVKHNIQSVNTQSQYTISKYFKMIFEIKNLSPNFRLKKFLYRGDLKCKF